MQFAGIRTVTDAPGGVYILMQSGMQTIMPNSAFASQQAKSDFVKRMQETIEQQRIAPTERSYIGRDDADGLATKKLADTKVSASFFA